eukprot:6185668-Pleurochrysis_carterae.AAC.1
MFKFVNTEQEIPSRCICDALRPYIFIHWMYMEQGVGTFGRAQISRTTRLMELVARKIQSSGCRLSCSWS